MRAGPRFSSARPLLLLLALATAGSLIPRRAAAEDSKALRLKVAILYKLLGYDREFRNRGGARVRIAVVIDRQTAARKVELGARFSRLKGRRVLGRPLSVELVTFDKGKDLDAAAKGAGLLFVPAGSAPATLKAAVAAANRHRVPLASGSREGAVRGAALAVPIVSGRAKIVVNFKASRRQRFDLPGPVLRLAEVLR